MRCRVLDSGSSSAANNMFTDKKLLAQLEKDPQTVVHWYGWSRPSLTYGHFIQPENFLRMDQLKALEVDHARRPTGGGLLFHTGDLTFSVVVPASHPAFSYNTLENYALINKCVAQAIYEFFSDRKERPALLAEGAANASSLRASFCMAQPTRYDVMIGLRKVGGAAQRRTRYGFLHQGSICLALTDPNLLHSVLLEGTQIAEAMKSNSFPLLGTGRFSTMRELAETRTELKKILQKKLMTALDAHNQLIGDTDDTRN